jgi:hypothetical protein
VKSARGYGEGLETIIVTAQKMPEDLQKTAAAITAIRGETLIARRRL